VSNTKHCTLGRDPARCAVTDIAAVLPKGIGGNDHKRLCPCHDDTEASLYIDAGSRGQRIVWCCYAGCDKTDIRMALLALGVDESCLGNYGRPEPPRTIVPGLRTEGHSPGITADAKRWQAMWKLSGDLPGKLFVMCRQAIAEGDGDLPGDPFRLLPRTRTEFIGLARRSGIQHSTRYALWDFWLVLLSSEEA
jgi:hypothetical protein